MAPLTQENLHKFLEGKSTSVARRVLGNPKAMVKNCPSSEQELQIKKEVENRASFAKFQKLVLMIEQTIVDHRSIEEQAFVNKFYNHFHKKKAHEPKVESATKTWEATSATANKPLSRLEL